ncbi:MAG TPA: class I SAM-dependent methyltransferase [Candidatus Limnocylindrales bacterium]|nr:class I SAM-dependent methyltransferase [Candidatus Limnocylindrales bacterium]
MAEQATRPRASFDCLWCGRSWTTRSPDDLEGWAQLCPDCLGKAGENPFLKFRLRDAITARGASGRAATPPEEPADATTDSMVAYYEARATEYDDWYLRRGRYERGPIHDAAWNAELDGAGTWLDAVPFQGEIVELAAGTGWWSPLLASKGELWLYDAAEAPLERARERLVAHRLRAHIHLRDAWAEPDRQVDGVFCGFWLSHVERERTAAFLALVGRWLKPGGRFAFIDSLPDAYSSAVDHPQPANDTSIRRLDDGREFTIVKVYRDPPELETTLRAAGFDDVQVTTTGRFFVLGSASAT